MNLPYSGKLTKSEYLRITQLNTRRILKKGGFHIDFWVLLFGIGTLLLLISMAAIRQWVLSQSNSFPWYIFGFIAGIFVIVLGFKFRAQPAKFWDENQASLSRMDGTITDDEIELVTPNGNLKMNWSEFDGYGEYLGMIVLYKPPLSALPFIDHFFEKKEDWEIFRNMVVERLPLTHLVNQISAPKFSNPPVYILFILSIIMLIIYGLLYGK
jgi:hypothetical protein